MSVSEVGGAGLLSSTARSEGHLHALFDQTAAGLAEVDLSGRFVAVNRRYCTIVGRSHSDLLDLRMQDITHPDDLPLNLSLLERLIGSGEPFAIEKRYVRPDGTTVWVKNNVSLIRDDSGQPSSILAVSIDFSDSKGTEAALRKSEEHLRIALAVGKLGDWSWDAETDAVSFSEDGAAMFGLEPDEAITFAEMQERILYPDDVEPTVAAVEQAIATGDDYAAEYRIFRSGGIAWIAAKGRPTFDQGRVTGLIGVVRDITEERVAEDEAREQSRILETLNRTGAALAGELDLHKIVQMVTDAGVELTGAQFGAFFYNVLNDQGEYYMLYALSGADPSQFEFGMPRNTAVFHPTFSGEGTIRSDDITADPRYGQMGPHFGMPKGHLPVRSYLAVPVISRSSEVLGGLFFGHGESARFTDRHERLMLGIASQAAVSIDNARLYQAVQKANETLEQRVAERTDELAHANEALRQAQKMEAIGQLTGGIAHDFNNMLTVIRGSADVLRRADLGEDKRKRYIDAIADTADRAARLTGQLLAFARRQALKPERFDAAERVRSISEMLGTLLGSRIVLEVDAECNNCFVEADAAQFEAALVNMAVNARDAMDGEGRLRISISNADQPPPSIGEPAAEAYVAVSVTDSGHGIAGGDLDKIFEPFFTTKEVGKGTGLGLSQVYGFAKQSGGEISVDSRLGEGATFTLFLPRAHSGPVDERREETPSRRIDGGGRVLIVEDNNEVGLFAEQVLADLGYQTVLADNAHRALELLEAGGEPFDVVFSDVVMPGMDGVEFARTVQKRWPHLPIILTSGYSHVLAGKSSHGFPLLQKPYSLEALASALGQAWANA